MTTAETVAERLARDQLEELLTRRKQLADSIDDAMALSEIVAIEQRCSQLIETLRALAKP